MPARRRGLAEVEEAGPPAHTPTPSLLLRLRNFWVFACLMQFIYLFGDVFKIDKDFDIEELEDECMNHGARTKLAEIGLCLLKSISSQRGLTSSDFDEYTSRQFRRRLPDHPNPYGDEEQPKKFLDFDVFTQLRILHQLSLWTLLHPERIRDKMPNGDKELDWRIDVIGWDREERSYFLLDDSRLYRRTDPPSQISKPKSQSRPKSKPKPVLKARPARPGVRASKRLKLSESEEPVPERDDVPSDREEAAVEDEPADNNETDLGDGYRWECVAITLQEYESLLASLQKSRDPNERNLHRHLIAEVLPQIQKSEENRQKKIAQRQRELFNLEKLAHAKRSSRIAGKAEREREEAEIKAAEEKYQRDLGAAKAEAARQKQMEEARESRMMTREQRLKDREYKRLLHEEELANMSKVTEKLEAGEAKISERRLKAEMAKKQKELEELQQEEDWVFDCAKCGVYGENIDDGTPSIACERCNVWQHCACLGVPQEKAEKDDFHFICDTCIHREKEAKQREEDAKKPKLPPLKLHVPAPAATPPSQPRKRGRPRKHPLPEGQEAKPVTNGQGSGATKKRKELDSGHVPGMPPMKKFKAPKPRATPNSTGPGVVPATPNGYEGMRHTFMNGPTLSPQGQINASHTPNGAPRPPQGVFSTPRHQPGVATGPYASPYGVLAQQPTHAQNSNSSMANSYGYTNGHSPVKQTPRSPAVTSSPSLTHMPSPLIAPPKKDMQAAGISPTKQSPPVPPFGPPVMQQSPASAGVPPVVHAIPHAQSIGLHATTQSSHPPDPVFPQAESVPPRQGEESTSVPPSGAERPSQLSAEPPALSSPIKSEARLLHILDAPATHQQS